MQRVGLMKFTPGNMNTGDNRASLMELFGLGIINKILWKGATVMFSRCIHVQPDKTHQATSLHSCCSIIEGNISTHCASTEPSEPCKHV